MTDDDIDETDPDYVATARRASEYAPADRAAALAAVLARADRAAAAAPLTRSMPPASTAPVPPVIGGKLVKDMTPAERALAAERLGINLHHANRRTSWR